MPKPNLNFKVGDTIIRKGIKGMGSQELVIDFIDYTSEVYIFEKAWINSLSKFKSLHFDKVHELFKFKE